MRLEGQIKIQRKQVNALRKEKEKFRQQKNEKIKTQQHINLVVQLKKYKSKDIGKISEIQRQGQVIQTTKTFQNNKRKFYKWISGDCNKTNKQPDTNENVTVLKQGKVTERTKNKAECMNNIKGLEEHQETNIQLNLQRVTLRKVLKWKSPDYGDIPRFSFLKSTPIQDILSLLINASNKQAYPNE